MKCKDCVYHWKAEGEKYPRCHYEGEWEAPCEVDDYDDEQ